MPERKPKKEPERERKSRRKELIQNILKETEAPSGSARMLRRKIRTRPKDPFMYGLNDPTENAMHIAYMCDFDLDEARKPLVLC
jgi:hypothetical protein